MNLLFSATGRQSGKQKVVQSTSQVERDWQMGALLGTQGRINGRGLMDAPGQFSGLTEYIP